MRRLGPASIVALSLLAALPLRAQVQAPAQVPAAQAGAPSAAAPSGAAAAPAAAAAALPVVPAGPENPFRRFEIVSLGAFPIMLFYSGFCFDLERYIANGYNSQYAPWPFQNQYSAPLTDADRYTRIGAALGACVVVGAIDAYIHAMKVKKARRLREAQEASEP
jgi:hypothetical protein